jgi:hypothetical protein
VRLEVGRGSTGDFTSILAAMDDRNAEREAKQSRLAASAKPGRIIILGAVAMAFGAMMTVRVLRAYAVLAGQPPEMDDAEIRPLRAPEMQWALWVTFVESAFLLAAGVGLVKLRRWARSMFFALAITRVCVLTWHVWQSGVADSTIVFAFSLLRLFGLYGLGVWLLTRPGADEVLEPRPE